MDLMLYSAFSCEIHFSVLGLNQIKAMAANFCQNSSILNMAWIKIMPFKMDLKCYVMALGLYQFHIISCNSIIESIKISFLSKVRALHFSEVKSFCYLMMSLHSCHSVYFPIGCTYSKIRTVKKTVMWIFLPFTQLESSEKKQKTNKNNQPNRQNPQMIKKSLSRT